MQRSERGEQKLRVWGRTCFYQLNMAGGEDTVGKDREITDLGVVGGLLELGYWKDAKWDSEWDFGMEIVTALVVVVNDITRIVMAVSGGGKREEHWK